MAEITGKTEAWNGHSFSEVESYIKNFIPSSGDATNVSSASSIVLEASDGSFVTVKRDSFVNAIRDVLGSSIVANTGGTSDVNTIPALTSSGGLKSISTSDIAQVLGVVNEFSSKAFDGNDLNDLKTPGVYIIHSYTNNAPSIFFNTCIVWGTSANGYTSLFQLCFPADQYDNFTPKFMMRRLNYGTWSEWYNYSPNINLGSTELFDSAPPSKPGIWVSKGTTTSNPPSGVSGGLGVTVTFCANGGSASSESNFSLQIGYFHSNLKAYIRYAYFGSGWYSWYQITNPT